RHSVRRRWTMGGDRDRLRVERRTVRWWRLPTGLVAERTRCLGVDRDVVDLGRGAPVADGRLFAWDRRPRRLAHDRDVRRWRRRGGAGRVGRELVQRATAWARRRRDRARD